MEDRASIDEPAEFVVVAGTRAVKAVVRAALAMNVCDTGVESVLGVQTDADGVKRVFVLGGGGYWNRAGGRDRVRRGEVCRLRHCRSGDHRHGGSDGSGDGVLHVRSRRRGVRCLSPRLRDHLCVLMAARAGFFNDHSRRLLFLTARSVGGMGTVFCFWVKGVQRSDVSPGTIVVLFTLWMAIARGWAGPRLMIRQLRIGRFSQMDVSAL